MAALPGRPTKPRPSSRGRTRCRVGAGTRPTASICARRRIARCTCGISGGAADGRPRSTRRSQRTRGRHLASGGKPIEAVFHANCGGHTSAAAEVWRSRGASYLTGVADPYCVREQPEGWTSVLDLESLRAALNQRPRTEVGDRLDGVQVLRRDAGGRVVELALSGSRAPVVTAEDFRLAVMAAAGPRSLRSARFEVERVGAQLRFVGRGSGHGVGLCQIGLIGRLRAGQSPTDALLGVLPGRRRRQRRRHLRPVALRTAPGAPRSVRRAGCAGRASPGGRPAPVPTSLHAARRPRRSPRHGRA